MNNLKITNFTMINTTIFNIRVSKLMYSNMSPLLISVIRSSTILCNISYVYVNRRYYPGGSGLPGSSGAGKTPKIPSSSSETKVPNTPYKKQDLEQAAESYMKSPIKDPSTPPLLPPYAVKQETMKFPVDANKPYYASAKALKDTEDHKQVGKSDGFKQPSIVTDYKFPNNPPEVSERIKAAAMQNNTGIPLLDTINETPADALVEDVAAMPFFIPTPPPLPSSSQSIPVIKTNQEINRMPFSEEIRQKHLEREQHSERVQESFQVLENSLDEKNKRLIILLKELERCHFLIYDKSCDDHYASEKIRKNFFSYLNKNATEKVLISLSNNELNGPLKMELGILEITDIENTVFLSRIQQHAVVFYTTINKQKIVWGFFTSEKDSNNIKLSETQPFRNKSKPEDYKEQLLHILSQPLIVKEFVIKDLSGELKFIGEKYLTEDKIKSKIEKNFIEAVVPKLKEPLAVYDGKGITEENIHEVLNNSEKKDIILGKKWYYGYKNARNKEQYLESIEKGKYDHLKAYEYFYELKKKDETK